MICELTKLMNYPNLFIPQVNKRLKKLFPHITLLLITFLFVTNPLQAKHIIGGEVTYVCNGNDLYTFIMTVYRDCDSQGAPFDPQASITIFRGNNSPYSQVEDRLVSITSGPTIISPVINPCMEVPNVCVEKATYQFSASLAAGNESYHVVYQRCCRNTTINNIIDPENTGATFTIELTPAAQQECNNSPVFNDFPPIVICAGMDINFDHSATDPDGDQLVYTFCSPIQGGGVQGTMEVPGDAGACNGVMPSPACPPPFPTVNFVLPTYSELNPMGGNPQITIDPSTGLISGVPDVQGQFVVGVCVEEYRNGVLLSVVSRDFQFNVLSCTPIVDALIDADEIIGDQNFVVMSCGSSTVNFQNQSIQEQNIDAFVWEFDTGGGNVESFGAWNPVVEFDGLGTYLGTLVLNPGTPCGDTAFIEVNIFPDINADFSFVYDTCVSAPVDFTDLSITDSGVMTNWDWDFGDDATSIEINPSHLYMIPGDLPVSLIVKDINGCMDTAVQIINYFPVPALIVVQPTDFIGCEPLTVTFDNLSFPIDSTYDIIWDFGDSTTANAISPVHTYEEGIYSVSVDITSPIGCQTGASWNNWVTALGSPTAGFDYNPKALNNFDNIAFFTDLSEEAVKWQWIFDQYGTSIEQNPEFTFPDTGQQIVYQIVTHESGCTDTALVYLDIVPEIRYYLPNAFTPNYDGLNDFFLGTGVFGGIENFSMTIWNRWGELIYETADPFKGWNGRKKNVGAMSPQGVYVYITSFIGPRGEAYKIKGYATLIK